MAVIKKSMSSYSIIAENPLNLPLSGDSTAIAAPVSTDYQCGLRCRVNSMAISGYACDLKISARQPAGKMVLFSRGIISSLYADTAWADKVNTLSSWKKLLYMFVLLGLFDQTQWKARFVKGYLAAMSLAAVIAVPLWLLDIQVKIGHEAAIFMTNHSSQSLAFLVAALCCIFLLKESISLQKKRVLAALLVLFLFNVFFISASRSGYLALPVAAVFAFVNLYGYKFLLLSELRQQPFAGRLDLKYLATAN
jgi:hypothetical protein